LVSFLKVFAPRTFVNAYSVLGKKKNFQLNLKTTLTKIPILVGNIFKNWTKEFRPFLHIFIVGAFKIVYLVSQDIFFCIKFA
jgi:hypothetical protein